MDSSEILVLNSPDIIFEKFEDEIVVINLKTGFYYGISGLGIPVWELVVKGIPTGEIADLICKAYLTAGSELGRQVMEFLVKLREEGLVMSSEKVNSSQHDHAEIISSIHKRNGDTPSGLLLEKYTDQQELLLLDPIHEVNELGWPEKDE